MIYSPAFSGTIALGRKKLQIDTRVEPLAETDRQFEDVIVCSKDDNVPRRVKDRRAYFAVIEVLLDQVPRFFGKGSVQVSRNVVPNVFAFYDQGSHLRFGAGFTVFSWGASCFCSIIRARCNRTFTAGTVIFRASAVSLLFSSSTSRRRNTSR